MNRIYKVIWSKVKHQYVVTSEFAHSCTKSTTSRVGKSAVAALAAFVLTAGVGGVHAESTNLIGEVTDDTITTTALSTDDVKYVIEGQELDITVTGLNDSGIIGGTASTYGLAIGENSNAYVGGVAVGSGSNASGVNAVAVGRDSHATADGASTFGYHSTANAARSVALGYFSTATEENTVSVGNDTLKRRVTNAADAQFAADSSDLVTAGQLVKSGIVTGTVADDKIQSMAVGDKSQALGNNATAIGNRANAKQSDATAVGSSSQAAGWGTAVGRGSNAGWQGTVIGAQAQATAKNAVAIGYDSLADEEDTVSVGNAETGVKRRVTNAADARFEKGSSDLVTAGQLVEAGIVPGEVTGENSTAIGTKARVNGDGSVALGNNTVVGKADGSAANRAVAIGNSARGLNDDVVAIGTGANASGVNSVVLGSHASASGANALAMGLRSSAAAVDSIAFGNGSGVSQYADGGIAIGANSYVGGVYGVAIGDGAKANGTNSTALGRSSQANGIDSVALGDYSVANRDYTVSVGRGTGYGEYDITRQITNVAAGTEDFDAVNVKQMKETVTKATTGAGMVQWDSTTDETTGEPKYHEGMLKGVSFDGEGSLTASELNVKNGEDTINVGETLAGYEKAGIVAGGVSEPGNGIALGAGSSANAGSIVIGDMAWVMGKDSIGLGNDISVGGNKAVAIGSNILSVADNSVVLGYGSSSSSRANTVSVGSSGKERQIINVAAGKELTDAVNVGQLKDAINDMGYDTTKGDVVQYDKEGNLQAGKGDAGKLNLGTNGSASLTSGNGDHSIVVDNTGTTVTGGLTVNGGLNIKDGDGNTTSVATSTDINGIKTDVSGIKDKIGVDENGNYKPIDNGAKDVITGINKNTDAIGDITKLKGTNANGETYKNLTDAVNGNYDRIEQNTTAIAQNSQAINSLGHQVSDLGDEIDSVGAISAALAGLHPLDYDGTGSKFQISAAMGTYDGTQAAAIGGFYHFNRDVMMSLGGATSFEGSKKTAANIGVTFRVGEGASGKSVSDDVMARLEAMDQKIAALEQENKELKNVLGAIDTSLSKEFPDVPANHWAYEAVTKLAGNDVVAGYPDGEFHGDRTMTRYEMAEIIYKAMSKGVQVDQKLVEEFKPEMEQVAANTEGAETTPAAAAETAQPAEENA